MTTEKPKILLVEDNRIIADMLRFNFERSGCSVTVAHDGRRALESLEDDHFDAMITDCQMPHVSGEELCRRVRQDDRFADIPIFLCSAKGFELDMDRFKSEYQISGVFFKPFSPREVVQTAKEAIEERVATAQP